MVCGFIVALAVFGGIGYFGYSFWSTLELAFWWIVESWAGKIFLNGLLAYFVCIGMICTYIPFASNYPDRLKMFDACVGVFRDKLKAAGFFNDNNKQRGTRTYLKQAEEIQNSIDNGFIVIVNAIWMNFMIILGSALIYLFPYWDTWIMKSVYYFVLTFAATIGNLPLMSVQHHDLVIIERTQKDIEEELQDQRDLEREQQEAAAAAMGQNLEGLPNEPVNLIPPAENAEIGEPHINAIPQPANNGNDGQPANNNNRRAAPRPAPRPPRRNRQNPVRNQRRWRYKPAYPIDKFYEDPQRGIGYFGFFTLVNYGVVLVGGRVLAQGLVLLKQSIF